MPPVRSPDSPRGVARPAPGTGGLPSLALQHPTAVFAALAGALIILRALQFTEFQIPAAIAVLSTGGLEGVILSSVAAVTPLLSAVAVLAAGVALYLGRHNDDNPFWARVSLWVTAMFGAVLAYYTAPLGQVVGIALSFGYFAFVLLSERNWSQSPATMAGIVVIAASMFATGAWLPAERLTVRAETYTGYVLRESSDWTQILRLHGRLVITRNEEISEREACERQVGFLNVTLSKIVTDLWQPSLVQPAPPCPET